MFLIRLWFWGGWIWEGKRRKNAEEGKRMRNNSCFLNFGELKKYARSLFKIFACMAPTPDILSVSLGQGITSPFMQRVGEQIF